MRDDGSLLATTMLISKRRPSRTAELARRERADNPKSQVLLRAEIPPAASAVNYGQATDPEAGETGIQYRSIQ
jgi:hypothetical protein